MAKTHHSIETSSNQLQQLVQQKIIKNKQGVGAVVGIIENNQQYTFSIGTADVTKKKQLNNQSLFEIGSITKTFTAMALADMVVEGKVQLNDPISKYLPEDVRVPQNGQQAITLLSLATHNSGLPRLQNNLTITNQQNPYAGYDVDDLYEYLNTYQLQHTVGEQRLYSNIGFDLLGHVLSLIDNKPYFQVINSRVLKPLKLNNTFHIIPKKYQADFVDAHDYALNKTSQWDFDVLAGAGALRSNLKDMMHYLKANMQAQTATIKLSHAKQIDFGDDATDIGLAWIISKTTEYDYIWHNGGTGGFRTFIGFNPTLQKGIVMMANSLYELDTIAHSYLNNDLQTLLRPLEEKNIKLTQQQRQKLIGIYALTADFKLTVTEKNEGLFVQATGQSNFPVYANSATEFYYKVVDARLTFTVNDNGIAESVTLHQNGQKITGKRQQ